MPFGLIFCPNAKTKRISPWFKCPNTIQSNFTIRLFICVYTNVQLIQITDLGAGLHTSKAHNALCYTLNITTVKKMDNVSPSPSTVEK